MQQKISKLRKRNRIEKTTIKQKGTGRARQGSIRAPHMVGGGVTFGPQPRSYEKKTSVGENVEKRKQM